MTLLNYKVVAGVSIITERHNHMAAIKRSLYKFCVESWPDKEPLALKASRPIKLFILFKY